MASGVIHNVMRDGITWNNLNSAGTCKYAKKNGVVTIIFNGVASLTGNAWNTIGTLPQGYRPSDPYYCICGDGGSNVTLVQIADTGIVTAKPYASGTHYAYGIVSYPI